jgi:hypothetical protein
MLKSRATQGRSMPSERESAWMEPLRVSGRPGVSELSPAVRPLGVRTSGRLDNGDGGVLGSILLGNRFKVGSDAGVKE